MSNTRVITAEEFAAASAYTKGYLVYAAGERDDQPNIPANYQPTAEEQKEFARGQWQACLNVLDGDD